MKPRKFRVTFGGKESEVGVEELPGVTAEDFTPASDVLGKVEVQVNSERYFLVVEEAVTPVEVPVTKTTAAEVKGPVKVEGNVVEAPMQGTITKILVKEGDEVKKGTQIAILEAMKMENLIECPFSGLVKKILVTIGSKVARGNPLVVVG